jgi:thiol-disulfide isomerase/thioredoxin
MEKATAIIVIIIIVLLGLAAVFFSFPRDNKDEEYGEAFVFSLLNGEKKNMSEYQGKIVILDFMGATCGPCQNMMIVLKQISEDYRDKIEIVSIDVWIVLGETPGTLQQMLDLFEQQGINLDWTFGYDDTNGTLFHKYASQEGVPIIHILDENGNIYYTKNGYLDAYSDYYELSEKIDELLD